MSHPEAWLVVSAFGSATNRGTHILRAVPGLLKRLLVEGMWQEFTTPRGELVRHERFVDFLTTPPTQGIGTSVEVVRSLLRDDPEALDLLDRALQSSAPRPRPNVRERWLTEVLRTDRLNNSAKLVLVALSRQMNQQGRVRYKREDLAADVGMKSLQRITDRIKEAKDAGFLIADGGGINGTVAQYYANLPGSGTPLRGTSSRGRGNGSRGTRNGVPGPAVSAGPGTPPRGAIRARVATETPNNGTPPAAERGSREQHPGRRAAPPTAPALRLAPPVRRASA